MFPANSWCRNFLTEETSRLTVLTSIMWKPFLGMMRLRNFPETLRGGLKETAAKWLLLTSANSGFPGQDIDALLCFWININLSNTQCCLVYQKVKENGQFLPKYLTFFLFLV